MGFRRTLVLLGYARVSTDGQTLDAQQAALTAAGAERVYAEKISSAVTERKALAKALAALATGDALLVTRLDRLARLRAGASGRTGEMRRRLKHGQRRGPPERLEGRKPPGRRRWHARYQQDAADRSGRWRYIAGNQF